MDGDLYHYWVETVFLPDTEELRRTCKILLIIDNFSGHTGVIAAECALTATVRAEESPDNPAHATLQGALHAAAGGQPEPKLPKKVTPANLQRAGAALETAAKAEEKKEQQVNKAEEVANAKCRKTEVAEAVAEAELSVLGAHVKVADAKIAAGQDSSARERHDARDEMRVFDSSDNEEGEEEIEEEENEDAEQGEDELKPAYIDQDDEWLNW
eukprot:jgi/Tetstr1/440296/TSEL_003058.t1